VILQVVYQQPEEKKESEFNPDIQGFYEEERLVKKVETIFQPQYLVEPPYMEGSLNLSGPPDNYFPIPYLLRKRS
jgi:hypothetical protein